MRFPCEPHSNKIWEVSVLSSGRFVRKRSCPTYLINIRSIQLRFIFSSRNLYICTFSVNSNARLYQNVLIWKSCIKMFFLLPHENLFNSNGTKNYCSSIYALKQNKNTFKNFRYLAKSTMYQQTFIGTLSVVHLSIVSFQQQLEYIS